MSQLERKLGRINKIGISVRIVLLSILSVLLVPSLALAQTLMIKTAPNELPSGAIDEEYEFQLKAGGTGSLTWSLSSGTLPPGLNLDSIGGLIFGTPTNPLPANPLPDVKSHVFEVKLASTSPVNTVKRSFVLTIYKNKAIRIAALEKNCFLDIADLGNTGKWLPGDLTSNISVGPTVSIQLFRYNLATEKASFNAQGLGIGAALRFYNDNDMKAHPLLGTKSIRNIKPRCRATTFSNFESAKYPAHSWLSISPMLYASVPETTTGASGQFDLQPAIVAGFLQDLINIGVGFNLAGQNQGEVFLLMGIGTGFKF